MRILLSLLAGATLAGLPGTGQTLTSFRTPDVWQRFTANSLVQGPSRFLANDHGGMMFWFQQLDRANGELTGAPILLGADGAVDPTFRPGAFAYGVEAVAPAPGGKWVVAYTASGASVVARLLADGSVDPSFLPKGFSQGIRFLTPLADDSLLVVVSGNLQSNPHPSAIITPTPTVVKLLSDGQLDPNFNRPAFDSAFIFTPPLVDAAGRFLLGGRFITAGPRKLSVFARYLPNGQLDTSFAGSLSLPTELGGVVRGLGFQSDGKLVVVGDLRLPATLPPGVPGMHRNTNSFMALRFDANGVHDPSFKRLRREEIQTADYPRMLVVQPDDRLVVSAEGLRRLKADGSFDLTFKNAFTAPTFWVGALGDGRLVLPGGLPERGVSIFDANGEPDLSFGVRGFGSSIYETSFVPLPDGRVLLAGPFNRVGTEPANGLLLLDTNGVPVASHPGIGLLAPAAAIEAAQTSLAIYPAGPAGAYMTAQLWRTDLQEAFSGVRRIRTDGSVDLDFTSPSTPPRQVQSATDGSVWFAGLTAQSLVAGTPADSLSFSNPELWLARRQTTGTLVAGYRPLPPALTLRLGQVNRSSLGLNSLQMGGVRILGTTRAGSVIAELATVDGEVLLRKIGADGAVLETFLPPPITGNTAASSFPTIYDPTVATVSQFEMFSYSGLIRDAAELADGSFVVGGDFRQFPTAAAGPLVLLTPNGTVDTRFKPLAFGVSRPFSVPSILSVVVDGEDRRDVAGTFDRYGGAPVRGLVRLDRQGRLDPTFVSPIIFTDYPSPSAELVLNDSTLWVGGSFRAPEATFPRALWKLDLGHVNGLPPIQTTVEPGGQFSLQWSAALTDVVFEAATDLTGDGNWQPATLTVTESDGVKSVTLPLAAKTEFFRIRRLTP